jgi:hypothetical protein
MLATVARILQGGTIKVKLFSERMEILAKLFGSAHRVKIIKLFLFNPAQGFSKSDVMRRAKVSASVTRKEINMLEQIGMLKRCTFYPTEGMEEGDKPKGKKTAGFMVNPSFEFLRQLQSLLIHINPLRHDEVLKRLSSVGKLKLVIIAGVFIQNFDSRLDILIVGDRVKTGMVDQALRYLESEIGKELRYAVFETDDFKYRLNIYDKLVRDVLDYPHQKIVNKIDIR